MALFNSKSKKEEKKADAPSTTLAPVMVMPVAAHALLNARITEKATDLAARNVYVFDVALDSNKRQVIEAVRALYKVTPISVHMVRVPQKTVRHPKRGVKGVSKLGKKAYVQLKDGDTISLM